MPLLKFRFHGSAAALSQWCRMPPSGCTGKRLSGGSLALTMRNTRALLKFRSFHDMSVALSVHISDKATKLGGISQAAREVGGALSASRRARDPSDADYDGGDTFAMGKAGANAADGAGA